MKLDNLDIVHYKSYTEVHIHVHEMYTKSTHTCT